MSYRPFLQELQAAAARKLAPFIAPGRRRSYLLITLAENSAIVLLLVQAIVLARVLGPAQLGIYSLAVAHLTLIGQLVCFGIPQAYTFLARSHPADGDALFNAALILLLSLSAVMSVLTSWLVPVLSPELPRSAVTLVTLAAYVPFIALRPLFRNALNIEDRFSRLALIPIVGGVVQLSVVVISAANSELTVWACLMAFILAAIARTVVSLPGALRRVRVGGGRSEACSALVRASPIFFIVGLALTFYSQAPVVILGFLGGAQSEIGFLSRAAQLGSLVPLAVQALMPLLFNHWAGRKLDSVRDNIRECAIIVALLIIPVTVVVILFGRWLLTLLFGDAFEPAYTALVILQFTALPVVLMNLLTQALGSRGAQTWTLGAYGGSALVIAGVAGATSMLWGRTDAVTVSAATLLGAVVGSTILMIGLRRQAR